MQFDMYLIYSKMKPFASFSFAESTGGSKYLFTSIWWEIEIHSTLKLLLMFYYILFDYNNE